MLDRLAGSFAKRGIAGIYNGRIRLAVSLMDGEGDGRQVSWSPIQTYQLGFRSSELLLVMRN